MSSNNIVLSILGWWPYVCHDKKCQVGCTFPINGDLYLIVKIYNNTMECIKLDRKSRKQFPYAKKVI